MDKAAKLFENVLLDLLCALVLVFIAWVVFEPMHAQPDAVPTDIGRALEENEHFGSEKQGTHGRFQIPSLNIDVALFDAVPGQNAQDIVDEEDSALFETFGVQYGFVGDHAYQGGFRNIRYAVPGVTVAEIRNGDEVSRFLCSRVCLDSTSTGKGFYDDDGNKAREQNPGGLTTVTCNNAAGSSVALVYWTPIKSN